MPTKCNLIRYKCYCRLGFAQYRGVWDSLPYEWIAQGILIWEIIQDIEIQLTYASQMLKRLQYRQFIYTVTDITGINWLVWWINVYLPRGWEYQSWTWSHCWHQAKIRGTKMVLRTVLVWCACSDNKNSFASFLIGTPSKRGVPLPTLANDRVFSHRCGWVGPGHTFNLDKDSYPVA